MTKQDSRGTKVSRYRLKLLKKIVRLPHRSASLSIIAFSDWRVQDIETLIRFIKTQKRPDVILYAGDDITRFRFGRKNRFAEIAKLSQYGLCAVAGNDDSEETRELIGGRGVYPVHSRALILGGFAIVGVEGAPLSNELGPNYNIGYLLYPEGVLTWHMKSWNASEFRGKKLIIVSHTPPYGVLDFAIRFGRRNIGSRPLREFIEASQNALLCICGHVHRCGGQSARLRRAFVVNVSSHDYPGSPGKVALIQITNDEASCIEWHSI